LPFDGKLSPNPVGCERIYNEISMEAWKLWIEQSKMIVNEYRLDLTNPASHKTLKEQCEAFFFGEGAATPPDFVPPPAK
jgi:Fe-S cluster biosynthesis and repair protein YggX